MTGLGAVSICFGGLRQRRRRQPCRNQGRRPIEAAAAAAAVRVARWARRHWPRQAAPEAAKATEPLAGPDDRDWSALPEDLLLIAMASMEVLDVVQSGAVWRSAYAQFRHLRLSAKPNPLPCLLHTRATDGAAAIYSLSTGRAFPCGAVRSGIFVAGSAHGWVFAVDSATADPFLVNPLTGARASLPRLATLERIKGTSVDADGTVVYEVDHWLPTSRATAAMGVEPVTARRACSWMFRRVAISATGVVLLVHMPHGEASYARPGDDRWTSLSPVLAHFLIQPIIAAVHDNDKDLFYMASQGGTIFSVDLSGGPAPVGRPVSHMVRELRPSYKHSYYLVFRGKNELLLVTRHLVTARPRAGEKDVWTTEISMETVCFPTRKFAAGIGDDYAMFLGHNQPMCLPVKDYPMLQPNCAYLADDSEQHFPPITRRDVGIWDFGSSTMEQFGGDPQPWMDEQPPIWITPSLY